MRRSVCEKSLQHTLGESALGGSTPGALCGHQKKHRFRGKTNLIHKVCSLPVVGRYEDTNGREVHFSAHLHIYEEKIQIIMRCTFDRAQLLLVSRKIPIIIMMKKSTQLFWVSLLLVIITNNYAGHLFLFKSARHSYCYLFSYLFTRAEKCASLLLVSS